MEEQEKRGRGRPPGSLNKPKAADLSPEERDALKQRLARNYAEAITAEAVATDRRRRAKALIRASFGVYGVEELNEMIAAAQAQLLPQSPWNAASTAGALD